MPRKPKADRISPELRKAEREIDNSYKSNILITLPFARAAWYFLAYCEFIHLRPMIDPNVDGLSMHERRALVQNVATHSKHPLNWMRQSCQGEGSIPQKYRLEMDMAASQLSGLSNYYASFESAYTYATIGAFDLSLEGTTIVPGPQFRNGDQYKAYDLLTNYEEFDRSGAEDVGMELEHEIFSRVKVSSTQFRYKLRPRFAKLGVALSKSIPMGSGPQLPDHWTFSKYSVADFRRWGHVLRGLCFIHHIARVRAAQFMGNPSLGYANSLIIISKRVLYKRFIRYTGLSQETINALFEDFTYGSRNMRFPDPILQPLIPLLPNRYGIAPHLILSSSMERNFAVLMNRIPKERKIYNSLSGEREGMSRKRIVSGLSSLPIRHWNGNVPGWNRAREIDLALIEELSKCCLILELKSFVAPDEVRETWDRSKEIKEGVKQVRARRRLAASIGVNLFKVLKIDRSWSLGWAVASETSVGGVFAQADDVAVVRTGHLIRKILKNCGLDGIKEWLDNREYLPVEGKHYLAKEHRPKVGRHTLKWSRLDMVTDNPYI